MTSHHSKGISFVIPVYRSAECLLELHRRLCDVFGQSVYRFEIIFIEDCGGDGSWDVIKKIVATDSRVKGFKMSRNFGQHNAILCGIRQAQHDVVVTLDDDLQHPPEVIPQLIECLDEHTDVVYGPPESGKHGVLRDLASHITKMALREFMGAENARNVSALRVFRTKLREAFVSYRGPTVNIDVLLTWATNRFTSLKVRHDARACGVSGYNLGKLLTHAFNMLTGFSARPLQMASAIGLMFALFGMCILIFVLTSWMIAGSVVPGFAFLASIVAVFSGTQLLALGIMGEYMARIHFRTMDQPTYVISEITKC